MPQRSLLIALGRAGVTVNPNIGIRVTKRVAYDRTGVAFATHRYDQYSTSWSLLYNLLRDAFPMQHFHAGRNVKEVVQDRDRAIAIVDDGTTFEGDLLIGADGMRSVVRRALFPEVQPQYVGYLAWRGMLEERHAAPEFVESCFSALNFSFPKGEELIGYPVAGANGDRRRRRAAIQYHVVSARCAGTRAAEHVHRNRRRALRDRHSPKSRQARAHQSHEGGGPSRVFAGIRRCHRAHGRDVRAGHLRSGIRADGSGKDRNHR